MLELSVPQRCFVVALCETGGTNETEAARIAGYGDTGASTRAAAYRLAHNPKVLAAIREECERRMKFSALLATDLLVAQVRGKTKDVDGVVRFVDEKLRQKAAIELLNRAGLVARTEHKVTIEDTRTDKEMVARIKEIARMNGLDETKLLGDMRTIAVDADYEEVRTLSEEVQKNPEFVTTPEPWDEFTLKPGDEL